MTRSKLSTYIMLAIALAFIFCACSPAKHVQKQDDNLNQLKAQFESEKQAEAARAVAEWIAKNPCIFPEYNLDSICGLYYHNPDPLPDYTQQDTVWKHDTAYISKKGKNILIPTPDKRTENLLYDSVKALTQRLAECNARAAGKKEAQAEIKVSKWAPCWWMLIAIGELIILVIAVIMKIKSFGK